jgi:hypothetical protein
MWERTEQSNLPTPVTVLDDINDYINHNRLLTVGLTVGALVAGEAVLEMLRSPASTLPELELLNGGAPASAKTPTDWMDLVHDAAASIKTPTSLSEAGSMLPHESTVPSGKTVTVFSDLLKDRSVIIKIPTSLSEQQYASKLPREYNLTHLRNHIPPHLETSFAKNVGRLSELPPSAAVLPPSWLYESSGRLPIATNAAEDKAIRNALTDPAFLSKLDTDPVYLEAHTRAMTAARFLISPLSDASNEYQLTRMLDNGNTIMLFRMRDMALSHTA